MGREQKGGFLLSPHFSSSPKAKKTPSRGPNFVSVVRERLLRRLELSKPRRVRRQWQRETPPNKIFMRKTKAPVHVHYNSLYISLSSSAKQQREMTAAKFPYFFLIWN